MAEKKPKEYMQLQEFVTESITAILEGLQKAQESPSVVISKPYWNTNMLIPPGFAASPSALNLVPVMEFDIAVTVTISGEGKAGIGVVSMGLGASAHVTEENSQISRIHFSVPFELPIQKS